MPFSPRSITSARWPVRSHAAAVYQVLARTAARGLTPRAASGLRLGRLGGYIEATLHPGVRAADESAIERIAQAGVGITPRQLANAEDIAPTYHYLARGGRRVPLGALDGRPRAIVP